MADIIKMTNHPTIEIPQVDFVMVDVELDVSTYEEESEPIHMYISPDTEPDVEMGYTEQELEDALEYWEHLHDYDY